MQYKADSKQAERYRNLAAECGEILQQTCFLRTALSYPGRDSCVRGHTEMLGTLEKVALLLTIYKAVAELEYSILQTKDSHFPIPDLDESNALLARISDAAFFGRTSLKEISGYVKK